jgi:hypothetical protein
MAEMTKAFKAESFTGRQKYDQLYEDFADNIKMLNENSARVDFVTQYVEYK